MLFDRLGKRPPKFDTTLQTTVPMTRMKAPSLEREEPSFMLVVRKLGLGFVLDAVSLRV